MIANYLYSLPPEAGGGDYAQAGLPVVPWYMPSPPNMFVAVGPFKFSPYAEVMERDIDLDVLAQQLAEYYPGIPLYVHENFVLSTALAAAKLKPGARVRPIITSDEASLQVINAETVVRLWATPPTQGKMQ